MRITAGVTGVLLIAAVAIAQDDSTIAEQVAAAKKHVSIGSVEMKVTTGKKDRSKTQSIKVLSEQDPDDPFIGTMRLTVEMEAGDNMWYGQQQQTQKKQLSKDPGAEMGKIDYTGEDSWTFKIALTEGLEKANIKAYAAEYGFVVSNKVSGSKFVVVAAKYDRVESADEITARNQDSKNVIKIKSSGKALRKGEGDEEKKAGSSGGGGDGGGGGGGD